MRNRFLFNLTENSLNAGTNGAGADSSYVGAASWNGAGPVPAPADTNGAGPAPAPADTNGAGPAPAGTNDAGPALSYAGLGTRFYYGFFGAGAATWNGAGPRQSFGLSFLSNPDREALERLINQKKEEMKEITAPFVLEQKKETLKAKEIALHNVRRAARDHLLNEVLAGFNIPGGIASGVQGIAIGYDQVESGSYETDGSLHQLQDRATDTTSLVNEINKLKMDIKHLEDFQLVGKGKLIPGIGQGY